MTCSRQGWIEAVKTRNSAVPNLGKSSNIWWRYGVILDDLGYPLF
jgi:hypothetical protein